MVRRLGKEVVMVMVEVSTIIIIALIALIVGMMLGIALSRPRVR